MLLNSIEESCLEVIGASLIWERKDEGLNLPRGKPRGKRSLSRSEPKTKNRRYVGAASNGAKKPQSLSAAAFGVLRGLRLSAIPEGDPGVNHMCIVILGQGSGQQRPLVVAGGIRGNIGKTLRRKIRIVEFLP